MPSKRGLTLLICEAEITDRHERFYTLAYSETVTPLPSRFILLAGNEWARIAQRLILESLDTVTIENLRVGLPPTVVSNSITESY